jgi:hypothetical protein
MDIRITRKKEYSIIVVEDELRALVSFLSSNYEPVNIIAQCNDGSSMTTSQLEDIINFENPSSRKIESLHINFGKSYSQGGNVEFGGGVFLSTCNLTIKETDDAKALKVAKEIEHRFEECRPWYSNLGKYFIYGLGVFLFILLSLFVTGLFLVDVKGNEAVLFSKISISIFQGLALGAIVSLVGTYLIKGWFWIFPKIWFDIGKQKAELQTRIKVRNFIFVGVISTLILGVIASIIATLITNRLPR